MKAGDEKRANGARSKTGRFRVALRRSSTRFRLHKTAKLDKLISSVEKGNRVVLGRDGEDLAAVVPLGDYRLLEQLSSKRGDVLALLAALDAEALAARKGQASIPWATARQQLR